MVASFLGGGMGNPFAQDPMQLLSTSAMQGDPTPPVQAPLDPQTTGAVSAPPTASGPSAAAAPAAPGGGGFDLGSIGNKIGDAFSGRGILGGNADDTEIDPLTGAPKGLVRQANMRSLMQLGLTFLVAGQRMSNDQRAAILSKAPGLVGGGDDALNSFAKTRLEMAKLKLEQRKQLQEEQAGQQQMQALQSLTGGATAPSAGAQGVQAGAQALAAAAPAIAPGDANAAPGGGIPANAAAGYVPQGGPGQEMNAGTAALAAPAPAATPTGNALAPGGVPRGPLLSPADAMGVLANPTTAGRGQALSNAVSAAQARTVAGQTQYDPTTGTMRAPVLNGRGEVTGYHDMGKPTIISRDTPDGKYREKGFMDPISKNFVVTDRTDIKDPDTERQQAASIQIAKGDRDTLNTEHHDIIQKSLDTYDRMASVRQNVMDGKGVWGTGASLRQKAYNALVSLGYNFDNKLSDSLNTDADFMRVMKEGVATTIKNFNGAQNVSNTDLKFAQDVMQATTENNPEAVINALNNGMRDIRENVSRYNANATRHNSDLTEFGSAARRLTVPVVDRDFDSGERAYQEKMAQRRQANSSAPAGAAPTAQQPADQNGAPGVVRYVRDPKSGKIVRAQ
jgi:hypothetical protein